MWTLIWFGLAMLEAAAILFLVARVMRMTEKWGDARASAIVSQWSKEERGAALREIVEQETPGANATVKRMARIAREAL